MSYRGAVNHQNGEGTLQEIQRFHRAWVDAPRSFTLRVLGLLSLFLIENAVCSVPAFL